jgi:DNA-binding IscR family transcriptional regulator
MNRAGILRSVQGKQGGYQIARDLGAVMLDELIEAVSPTPALTACLHHDGKCAYQRHCNIRTSIARLDARVRDLFHEIPVLDLIRH